MFKMKHRTLGLAFALSVVGAAAAIAGPPWISIEYPVNPLDPEAKGGFVMVRTYHHSDLLSFEIGGTAEGLVNGQRQSAKLDIRPLKSAGTYIVNWKKPASGNWALIISTRRDGQHMATAVVKVDAAGQVASVTVPSRTIENGRWTVPRPVAASEVDAMLRNGANIAALSQ